MYEDDDSVVGVPAVPEPPFEPDPVYPAGLLERDWRALAAGPDLLALPSAADVADAVAGALPAGAALTALLEADSARPGGAAEVLERIRGWAALVAHAQGMLAGQVAALHADRDDLPAFLSEPGAVGGCDSLKWPHLEPL